MQGEKVVKKTEGKEMAANKYAGTQTEKNLQEAFAGESQARNKYTFFASVAKKEGYEQMSALFLKTDVYKRQGCLHSGVDDNSLDTAFKRGTLCKPE